MVTHSFRRYAAAIAPSEGGGRYRRLAWVDQRLGWTRRPARRSSIFTHLYFSVAALDRRRSVFEQEHSGMGSGIDVEPAEGDETGGSGPTTT